MELLICGSGASEAVPALFCDCKVCREAWKRGGKNFRSRTAYQLGDEIRIDFGPDIMLHREKYGLHYERLRHIFITHPHRDHFTPVQITYHKESENYDKQGGNADIVNPLFLYGTDSTRKIMAATPYFDPEAMKFSFKLLEHGKQIFLPKYGIRVTAVNANHDASVESMNLIFEMHNGYTFFIGTDSGRIPRESWNLIADFKFDLMIIDATAGLLPIEDGGHMTAQQALDTIRRFRQEGIAKSSCRFVTNHFAHCGGMLHEELEEFFLPHKVEPAYDGMRIDLSR